jgi:hypothetical protein
MQKLHRALVPIVAALAIGCGEKSLPLPPPQVVVGPHQGLTLRLPEDRGFAEIVNEPEVTTGARNGSTAIVVYFLQVDSKSPLTPAPTNVVVQLINGSKREAKKVPMAAEPKPEDPAGASRFTSKPGPYLLSEAQGVLTANVGGQSLSLEFSGGR